MQDFKTFVKGAIDNGGHNIPQVGVHVCSKQVKSHALITTEKEPKADVSATARVPLGDGGKTIGFHFDGPLMKPTSGSALAVGLAGNFRDTGIQYGFSWASKIDNSAFKKCVYNFYFNN